MLSHDVALSAFAYHLPATSLHLHQLAESGLLAGDVGTLEAFGFGNVRIATDESHVDMAVEAARRVLDEAEIDPGDVGLVLYAGALASSSVAPCLPPPPGSVLHLETVPELFRYPASILQERLGLDGAVVVGVNQQACASMFSAIGFGRASLIADPGLDTVLCVASDRLPGGVARDIVFNVVSDGACAVLLRRDTSMNRLLAIHSVTKPMLFQGDAGGADGSHVAEVVAAYFPTAARVIEDTVRKARLSLDDIEWVIPHNVSLRSWEILLGMLRIPMRKLFSANIARVGHTISADNLMNLRDAQDAGLLRRGDHLLLFTFGFGLNWSCMILEH
jgi:3-oxoacyl-[acyl-carrier-protein] synthase III